MVSGKLLSGREKQFLFEGRKKRKILCERKVR